MNPPSIIRLIKGTPKSGNPINTIEYNGEGLPSRIVYNVMGDTTEELLISYADEDNIVINGVEYKDHLLNIPSATLTLNLVQPTSPIPAIVDILLDNTSVDEVSPVGTVVGNITPVGGTAPYGYSLDIGDPYFKIVGDTLEVRQSIDGVTTPQVVVITVTDINQSSFSKSFEIDIIDNPFISDIILSNDVVNNGDGDGTVVGDLSIVGGTEPPVFTIDSDPSNKFKIEGNQLKLKNEAVFDEEPYNLSILVTDSKTRTLTKDFIIQVEPTPYISTKAISFNGVDQYCVASSNSSFNTPSFSLSFWVNFRGEDVQLGILRKNSSFRIRKTSNLIFEIYGKGGARKRGTVTGSQFSRDEYIHLVMTYDAILDKQFIYLNGEIPTISNIQDDPFTSGRQVNNNNLELGRYANTNFFKGVMDEVSYWNESLTQEQVRQIYNNGEPNNIKGNDAVNNLVSWWNMGELDTFPTITDRIGNNDLTMTNMSQANIVERDPYINNLSTTFNGIDESINCGNISITNNLSVFAWTKFTDANTRTIASKYSTFTGDRAFRFYFSSGDLRVILTSDGSSVDKDYLYTVNLNDDQWHFVGFTFENNNLKLYVDGAEVNVASLSDDPVPELFNSTFDLQIGQWGAGSNLFLGNIDELTIWDTSVLSDSDVEILYNQGEPNDPSNLLTNANLAHHYKMGDGSTAPILTDEVGSNNGTMVNMDQTNFVEDTP